MTENACRAMSRDGEGNCLAHGGKCCYNQAIEGILDLPDRYGNYLDLYAPDLEARRKKVEE